MAGGSPDQINTINYQKQQLLITGIVQGVGFRPFIYRLATEEALGGYVRNTSRGVEIQLIGEQAQIDRFHQRLITELPPLAVIDTIEQLDDNKELPEYLPQQDKLNGNKKMTNGNFEILSSHSELKGKVKIPADIATCQACKQEVLTATDRHFYYPLTNCTECGPRFTVIKDVPYDRKMTTMKPFPMCPECQKEYDNPLDRRFHAQPTACVTCGPYTRLLDRHGNSIAIGDNRHNLKNLLEQVANLLTAGEIIAIKGIGGFHFVCDADNDQTVMRLRKRKHRPNKPLAVMAKDIDTVVARANVSDIERQLLTSHQAPIVILDKKTDDSFLHIAPDMHTVGVMLPYTPLQMLLFANNCPNWLVMTSANQSNMPIVIGNHEAINDLQEFVDYILVHDRDIIQRCDDSLVRVQNNTPTMIRTGRGYAPNVFKLPLSTAEVVLAVGGEMKNVFAYAKNDEIIISQHIGEIDSWEGRQNFLYTLGHYERLFDIEPDIVAYDKHPSYQISEIAKLLNYDTKIEIQHHHAHMASCMAEHNLSGTTLGIILDGTGYGDDESLWGFEFLLGDYKGYERIANGLPLPVIGGEQTIKQPWRMAVAVLSLLDSKDSKDSKDSSPVTEDLLADRLTAKQIWPDKQSEIDILNQLLKKEIQVINSSGAGRLFDAVAALLKICEVATYEGEAAIRLENSAKRYLKKHDIDTIDITDINYITDMSYNVTYLKAADIDNQADANQTTTCRTIFDWRPMFVEILQDIKDRLDTDKIAYKFHLTIAKTIIKYTLEIMKNYQTKSLTQQIKQIVLSGGTWHNELLLQLVKTQLAKQDIKVFSHQKAPTNDGGIALGQAVIAIAKSQTNI